MSDKQSKGGDRRCDKLECLYPHCADCGWNPDVDAARRAAPQVWIDGPGGTRRLFFGKSNEGEKEKN